MQSQVDELTINEFNKQIRDFFSFLKSLCHQYFKGLKRNKTAIISLLIITISVTTCFIFYPIKKFDGRVSYRYNDLTKKFYGELIDNVDVLIQTHSYRQFQQAVHLPLKQIESIQKLNAINIYGSPLSDDMAEGKDNIFYVSVVSSNIQVFDSLGVALENYLNNNVAVREILQRKREEFTEAINYRKDELLKFDSLTNAYTKSLEKPGTSIVSGSDSRFNPTEIFDRGERVTQEIVDMQNFLKDLRAVKLQTPFLVSIHPKELAIWKIILSGFCFFIILSVLIIFLKNVFSNN